MKLPVTTDITAPYSALQAWAYETWVAGAVISTPEVLGPRLLNVLPAGGHLLDVGCGGGRFAAYIAERWSDVRITGIDLSPAQVERARRATARFGDRVHVQTGSALDLPFSDSTFDGILSCGSIKHWPDKARGISECLRVLKTDGPLLLTEADRSCRFEDARSFVAKWPIPSLLRPAALTLFRTWVAGQSIDLEDARHLARTSALRDPAVERIPDSPLLLIAGRR